MGANLAPEVADEKFCETTIGAASLTNGNILRDIIQTDYFRVVVVNDVVSNINKSIIDVFRCNGS